MSTKETILIAEDSVPNRKILMHLLEKLGYNVEACEDGLQAREKLENKEVENLVAVISDIMMPNEDGLQLLKYVRGSEEYKDLPFILVTAVSEKEYILQAKSLNVNGYILKPVTFQRVIGKLKEIFPNKTFPNVAA
ncbi:MAG: response regulator [Bdellovibrio sp.]|nr:MAG: response regulator [Bdellovibrio sp.]